MSIQKLQNHINEKIQSIPSLPAMVGKILEITSDPNSSTQSLWEIISADQALSANILKIANSAFYGLSKKVGSLQHALSLLGYKEVRNLVITQTVFQTFKDRCKYGPLELGPFWAHAFTCAMGSQIISEYTGGEDQDLYTACLLHDIGKLVIYMALPEAYTEMINEIGHCGHTIFETEYNFFGLTHSQIAKSVLQKWRFPDHIIEGIAFHHDPKQAPRHHTMAWAIHITDLLVHWTDAEDRAFTSRCEQLQAYLLQSEITDLFGCTRRTWNLNLLIELRQQLLEMKNRQADIMAIFFA